jgi:uncharacterized protein (DUF2267 family)
MSATGPAQIEHAVQQTNVWLGELMMALGWRDRSQAYQALHTVLPLLRNHLPANEAADLSSQLPLFARALFFEGWHPGGEPIKDRSGDHFIAHLAKTFSNTGGVQPSQIATAVFSLLARHVSPGEVKQVRQALPEGMRRYWPANEASLDTYRLG